MARIIDAKRSTLVGTAGQIRDLLRMLVGSGGAIIDLKESNFVVLAKPLNGQQIREAFETVPRGP